MFGPKVVLTREELYQKVWSIPMQKLAAEFGYKLWNASRRILMFLALAETFLLGESVDAMPVGLAADAHYQKTGLGFQNLLETISDLTKLPRQTACPIDNERVRARGNEKAHDVIDCKDCLREFNITRTADIIRGEKWTTCVDCGKLVQFLCAEHSESA